MYYLRTRYYAPQLSRMLMSDTVLMNGTSLLGSNQFAYARNNPVMYTDEDGQASKWLRGIAIVVMTAVITVAFSSCPPAAAAVVAMGAETFNKMVIEDKERLDNEDILDIAVSGLAEMAAAFIPVSGKGIKMLLGSAAQSACSALVTEGVEIAKKGNITSANVYNLVDNTVAGFAGSIVGVGVDKVMSYVPIPKVTLKPRDLRRAGLAISRTDARRMVRDCKNMVRVAYGNVLQVPGYLIGTTANIGSKEGLRRIRLAN